MDFTYQEKFFNKKEIMNHCAICYSRSVKYWKKINNFDIWRCSNCALLWVPGCNEELLTDLYSKKYFNNRHGKFGYFDYLDNEPTIRLNAKHTLLSIPKTIGNCPKILDIGCAYGFWLDEARKLWPKADIHGIEINKEAADYATQYLNLNVYRNYFSKIEFSPNTFDIITLIDVIEHLIAPVEAIRRIYQMLKPGGYLVITTINTKGLIRLFDLKPPEHLYLFSAKNLSLLLKNEGLNIFKLRPYYCFYYLSDAVDRAFRLVFRSHKRIEPLLSKILPFDIIMRVPTNEMLILSQKIK